jgi:hypothetical protein
MNSATLFSRPESEARERLEEGPIPIDGCVGCRNDLLVGLTCIAVAVENERAKRDAMVLESNSNAKTQHKIAVLSPIRG